MNDLAVIPIFVNAGAAVLPAILAGLSSFLGLLLRPRELLRRPEVVICVVAAWPWGMFVGAWFTPSVQTTQTVQAAPIDWVQKAVDIIQQERALAGGAGTHADSAGASTGRDVVFGHDFARCNYDGGGVPTSICPLWAHKPEAVMFLSSPALYGQYVYVGTSVVDLTGNLGTVVCLQASTGQVVWETTSASDLPLKPIISSPAVTADGRFVLIGQGLHEDKDCSLLCLDAHTGKVVWQAPTPLHIEGSPAVRGDLVVAGAGAIEGADRKPTTHIGQVIGVRISDGKLLWTYDVADPESSPAIAEDGTVYIGSGFNGSAVVALRSDSDADLKARNLPRLVWRTPMPYPVTGAMTLAGEMVLVGGGNGDYAFSSDKPAGMVAALDRRDGHVIWQVKLGDAALGPLACRKGLVLCPVRTGEVVALNQADGAVLWRRAISGKAAVLAGCVLADNIALAVSSDGYLAMLDARDGRVLQKQYLNDRAKPGQQGLSISTPTLGGNLVLVGSETGGLRCFVCSGKPGAESGTSRE